MGTAVGLNSSSQCSGCPHGHYCLEQPPAKRGIAPEPIPCSQGSYNNESDQGSIRACKSCPENSNSAEGSTIIAACKCEQDYYDSEPESDAVECKVCPAGSACPNVGTTLASITMKRGYYRVSNTSIDLRECPDSSGDSSGCTGGVGLGEGPCKPLLHGPYCQLCTTTDNTHYYSSSESDCLKCSGDAFTGVGLAVVIVLVGLLLVGHFIKFRPDLKYERFTQLRRRLHIISMQISLRAKLKQCLSFYQVATRIADVYVVAMPTAAAQLLNSFEVFNINIAGIGLPLQCLNMGTYKDHMIVTMVVPVLLGAALIIYSVAPALTKHIGATVAQRKLSVSDGTLTWQLKSGLLNALPRVLLLTFLVFPRVSHPPKPTPVRRCSHPPPYSN